MRLDITTSEGLQGKYLPGVGFSLTDRVDVYGAQSLVEMLPRDSVLEISTPCSGDRRDLLRYWSIDYSCRRTMQNRHVSFGLF